MYSPKNFLPVALLISLVICFGPTAPWVRAADSPVAETKATAPFIILKLDDLSSVTPAWQRVVAFLEGKNIKSSIGIIGNSLEGQKTPYYEWIKAIEAKGLVEFWNHGFDHKQWKDGAQDVYEFCGPTYEQQKEHFERTQQLAKDTVGLTLRTFGAPFNQTDAATEKVLAQSADTKVWLYGNPSADLSGILVLDRTPLNIENPTFVPNLERLKKDYQNRAKDRDVFVLQGHPNAWNEARFADFVKIIEYLQEQGATFTTPYDYYLYRQTPEGQAAQKALPPKPPVVAVPATSAPSTPGYNILENGDFEADLTRWALFAPSVEGLGELHITTDAPHEGAQAGALTSSEAIRYAMVNYAKIGTFVPGGRYRVTAWVRASQDFEPMPGTPGFMLRVSIFPSSPGSIAEFTNPAEGAFYLGSGNKAIRGGDVSSFNDQEIPRVWTKLEGVLEISPEAAALNVSIFVWKGTGSFFVDDVALEEVDASTPLSAVDGR